VQPPGARARKKAVVVAGETSHCPHATLLLRLRVSLLHGCARRAGAGHARAPMPAAHCAAHVLPTAAMFCAAALYSLAADEAHRAPPRDVRRTARRAPPPDACHGAAAATGSRRVARRRPLDACSLRFRLSAARPETCRSARPPRRCLTLSDAHRRRRVGPASQVRATRCATPRSPAGGRRPYEAHMNAGMLGAARPPRRPRAARRGGPQDARRTHPAPQPPRRSHTHARTHRRNRTPCVPVSAFPAL
jgi:hypothetical protein